MMDVYEKKAVVIGSGIGGIAVAIRLKARGYQVDVLEKSEHPGGKLSECRSGDFRFDTGPSLFTLPALVDELFSLFGKKADDYFRVYSLPVTCNYFFPDGNQLKAWSDRQRFIEEAATCGANPIMVEEYLERQSFLYKYTSDFFLFNSIHRISSYMGDAGKKSLKALHRLDAFTSMHKRNLSFFGNTNLTRLFDRYATYNGSDPFRAPATLNMIAHLEHNTGAFFPEEGMFSIVQALMKLAEEEGVVFHFNTSVKTLHLIKGKVASVQTDNSAYLSDLVVNDTDILHFYRNILPDKKMSLKLSGRERSSSALIFYWGMNLSTQLDVHNILFSSDYRAEFKGIFQDKHFANDLTVYIFISKKVVKMDAPDGCENWFVMVNAPENTGQDWGAETERARKIILSTIKKRLNVDAEKYILCERVVTPVDIERNTSSVNGALYGQSSNSPWAAFLRHPNFSRKYRNLFFVGGSVHPGGGIPLCLASAKIVDNLIK